MNKLEEKHFDITKQVSSIVGSPQVAAIDCAAITTDYMKGLTEWIDENKICRQWNGKWFNRVTTGNYLTTSAMIEEYIKTL